MLQIRDVIHKVMDNKILFNLLSALSADDGLGLVGLDVIPTATFPVWTNFNDVRLPHK